MSNTPKELKYAKSHEWVRSEADGTVTVGITQHAQELLGDLVYVELPAQGTSVSAGKECSVVESVKAASDVYAPVSGEIVAVNSAVTDTPETINKEPYGSGWMFRIKPSNKAELGNLLDAAAYEAQVASEKH
jgi:glycine cleavage system H protein